jgi:hypothetical protein
MNGKRDGPRRPSLVCAMVPWSAAEVYAEGNSLVNDVSAFM